MKKRITNEINISKYSKLYIPSPKSEVERKIEIRYWKNKIREGIQKLGNTNYFYNIIERALAKVDKFENMSKHKSLLGNKHKYIEAIIEEFEND